MTNAPLDVLAFGPHPDDVELCCGGLLAKAVAQGHRVGVVDLTRGELASNGSVEERERESAAASRVLGLHHRENLGLPDGGLDASPGAGHILAVVEAIRRLRPGIVLAPHEHARHPDHVAASHIVRRASFLAGVARYGTSPGSEKHSPGQLFFYGMRGSFEPSFVVDITEVHDRKREALACYSSQLVRGGDTAETLANAPLNRWAFEARDGFHGAQIGVRYGEAYLLDGAVPIDDPVAHFRDGPGEALLYGPRR